MSNKEDAKSRGARLKQLRENHQESVSRAQTLLKEQQAVRREIRQAMGAEPKTVPQIAGDAGLLASEVLWHVTAMKKYDLVREVGMSGEYYLYQLTEEKKR